MKTQIKSKCLGSLNNLLLTNEQSEMIERGQKSAFAIILAKGYTSYKVDLKELERTTLSSIRSELCLKFENKSLKSVICQNWFCENRSNQQQTKTRSVKRWQMYLWNKYLFHLRWQMFPDNRLQLSRLSGLCLWVDLFISFWNFLCLKAKYINWLNQSTVLL